jgi:NAD(P)-dependent dehydrogenase (short-subunit alcohol dehydrogenase family)
MGKRDQVMLIVGGSSGMGLATARLAVNNGFRVIIASRSQAKLDAAFNKIDSQNATAYRVDTLDEKSTAELFEKVGKIDHLVITAAETDFLSIKTSSVNEVKELFDSRYFGPFRVTQAALEHMDPAGSITLFSGTAGVKAFKEYEVLASISAAIDGFARTLALTLAPIRVNSISPGLIDTPAIRSDNGGDDDTTMEVFQEVIKSQAVERIGRADEIAQGVIYLATNQFITGTTLFIDGGLAIS